MATYKAAVGVRTDCLYCALPLQIDSYWGCVPDCAHCNFRRLNRTWGDDLRPADPEAVERKLRNGLKNKNPRSPLAAALARKTTIRLGAKSDPYQDAEKVHHVTRRIQEGLIRLEWTYILMTRHLHNLLPDLDVIDAAHELGLVQLMPVISPGAELDWEVLEYKKTCPIPRRLRIIRRLIERGYKVGVNGEPFIPGYHTPEQFRDVLRRIKEVGVESYNIYNLHVNDLVLKRLHAIGLDIEKIWRYNQDDKWLPILRELLDISIEEGMRVGCPDFVNSGWDFEQQPNTCCGLDAPNPSTFNTHHWKRVIQAGGIGSMDDILEETADGIGSWEEGQIVLQGKSRTVYTMDDIVGNRPADEEE